MKKGLFITIYGINNIGKSTHARRLLGRLRSEGYEAVYVKYPVYSLEPSGPKINSIIRTHEVQGVSEEELQTLFMQNRKDYESTIKKWLEEGKIIIAEDYTGTGIAWGTAKGLDQKWLKDLNADLLKEDFAILMTGERAMNAKEEIHLHESNDDLVLKVADILISLSSKNGWHEVQVQKEIEDTAELMWDQVRDFIKISEV